MTEVSNILARHPDWDKSPCHLHLPSVTKSMDIISHSIDHIGPWSYLHPERLYPSGLTLVTPWKHGHQLVEENYKWALPILYCISTTQHASILALFRMSLITQHLVEEDDLDDRDSKDFWTTSHVESFSDMPDVNDCTMGMWELEDATVDAQWPNALDDRQAKFTNVIQIGNHTMNKSHAIAQHFCYARLVSLMDRLRCIA